MAGGEGRRAISGVYKERKVMKISIIELKEHLIEIEGIKNVHHIHVWSIDGYNNYATMHIVTDGNTRKIKELVKEELREHGINHTTIEVEDKDEVCEDETCKIDTEHQHSHHHHHHH